MHQKDRRHRSLQTGPHLAQHHTADAEQLWCHRNTHKLTIWEHFVRLTNSLEFDACFIFVVGIFVGMPFQSESSISCMSNFLASFTKSHQIFRNTHSRFLNLLVCSSALHLEHCVVIYFHLKVWCVNWLMKESIESSRNFFPDRDSMNSNALEISLEKERCLRFIRIQTNKQFIN